MYQIKRYSIQNPTLTPLIKHIWHFEMDNADIHRKLLPMDSIDIIMNLSSDMMYETDSQKIIAPMFHVNGLRNKVCYIHQKGMVNVIGISFYAFGLYPFVKKPMECIKNSIVDFSVLSISLKQKLENALAHNFIENKLSYIEQSLCSELQLDDDDMYKINLIKDFLETNEKSNIENFCKSRNINQKTFERTVLRYTGYLPKTLKQIKRFQHVSNDIINSQYNNLTDLAYDYNFNDQSHFIKDFQHFSGTNPRTFKQEKNTFKEHTRYMIN